MSVEVRSSPLGLDGFLFLYFSLGGFEEVPSVVEGSVRPALNLAPRRPCPWPPWGRPGASDVEGGPVLPVWFDVFCCFGPLLLLGGFAGAPLSVFVAVPEASDACRLIALVGDFEIICG